MRLVPGYEDRQDLIRISKVGSTFRTGARSMKVTAECPSCGRKYAADERFASRAASCKNCGAALQFSQPSLPSQSAPMLRVDCPDCHKSYKISSGIRREEDRLLEL